MRFARQSVAALSAVLLLQLSLLGSGTLCVDRHASAHFRTAPSTEAMREMAHDTTAPVAGQGGPVVQDAGLGCLSRSGSEPCHGPWAPGTCVSMSGCAWSQGVPFEAALASAHTDSGPDAAEPLALATGPEFAPETPPPRA